MTANDPSLQQESVNHCDVGFPESEFDKLSHRSWWNSVCDRLPYHHLLVFTAFANHPEHAIKPNRVGAYKTSAERETHYHSEIADAIKCPWNGTPLGRDSCRMSREPERSSKWCM